MEFFVEGKGEILRQLAFEGSDDFKIVFPREVVLINNTQPKNGEEVAGKPSLPDSS